MSELMSKLFFEKFNEKVAINKNEQEGIEAHLIFKRLRKHQYLLQEGDVCKYIAFVNKGALKSFVIEENGIDRIRQFAIEGWTISDLFSFLTEEPATLNIDALEDTELVLISKTAHNELLKSHPKYETYMRLLITNAYTSLQNRLSLTHSQSLEDQYVGFISRYPDISNRVPQYMIASYLGLTPETLSRLRRKMASKH